MSPILLRNTRGLSKFSLVSFGGHRDRTQAAQPHTHTLACRCRVSHSYTIIDQRWMDIDLKSIEKAGHWRSLIQF